MIKINKILCEDRSVLGDDNKYHFTYKITNKINNKYYYGKHTTRKLNDKYKGSGLQLLAAYNKYGIENFIFEILEFYNSEQQLRDAEKALITETVIKDPNSYNINIGGQGGQNVRMRGKIAVKDKDGNTRSMSLNDPRYLSGEYHTTMYGRVAVKDKDGNTFSVLKTDPRYLNGELVGASKGWCNLINIKTGKLERVESFRCGVTHMSPFKGKASHANCSEVYTLDGIKTYIPKSDPIVDPYYTYADYMKYGRKFKLRCPDGKVILVDRDDPKMHSNQYILLNSKRYNYKSSDGCIYKLYKNDPKIFELKLLPPIHARLVAKKFQLTTMQYIKHDVPYDTILKYI